MKRSIFAGGSLYKSAYMFIRVSTDLWIVYDSWNLGYKFVVVLLVVGFEVSGRLIGKAIWPTWLGTGTEHSWRW